MTMNKIQLRKHIATLVGNLSKSEKEVQSNIIAEKILQHPKYKSCKNVSIYLSTDKEVNTLPILEHAIKVCKKQCFVPVVGSGKNVSGEARMVMVRLRSMEDYKNIPSNHYGIKEPKDYKLEDVAPYGSLDLMLVPGVAFSLDGQRLGHGKGYYDEYLNNWFSKHPNQGMYTIGLCFREQLVDDPRAEEGHDFTLDEVITA